MVRSVEVFGSFRFIILHLSNRFHASLQWLAALGPWWVPGAGHAPEHGMGAVAMTVTRRRWLTRLKRLTHWGAYVWMELSQMARDCLRLVWRIMSSLSVGMNWWILSLDYLFARSKSVLDSTTTWHWYDIPVKCVFGSISQDLKMTLTTSGSHCEITSFLGLHPFIP